MRCSGLKYRIKGTRMGSLLITGPGSPRSEWTNVVSWVLGPASLYAVLWGPSSKSELHVCTAFVLYRVCICIILLALSFTVFAGGNVFLYFTCLYLFCWPNIESNQAHAGNLLKVAVYSAPAFMRFMTIWRVLQWLVSTMTVLCKSPTLDIFLGLRYCVLYAHVYASLDVSPSRYPLSQSFLMLNKQHYLYFCSEDTCTVVWSDGRKPSGVNSWRRQHCLGVSCLLENS